MMYYKLMYYKLIIYIYILNIISHRLCIIYDHVIVLYIHSYTKCSMS